MDSDFMFSAIVYTKDSSEKCKERTQRELEKMGFRVLFIKKVGSHMTIRCSKTAFEKVFQTHLKIINIQGGIGCEASTHILIPEQLKKLVTDIVIAPLVIAPLPH